MFDYVTNRDHIETLCLGRKLLYAPQQYIQTLTARATYGCGIKIYSERLPTSVLREAQKDSVPTAYIQ
jgi:hypothetical protein